MTNIKTCTIKILNKSYHIKCPASEETNLLLAADKLNEKITSNKSKFKTLDNFQVLLLAALDVGHELTLCKQEQEQQRHQVNQFITSLESNINKPVDSDVYEIQPTD
jgi:cell division protein ZapA